MTGYVLELISAGTHLHVAFNFSLRAISSVADVVSAVSFSNSFGRAVSVGAATAAGVV